MPAALTAEVLADPISVIVDLVAERDPGVGRAPIARSLAELLDRLLPPRRSPSQPPVIKRKVSGWPLKRAQHHISEHPPEPSITIVAATKAKRVKRTSVP
jgi:hypothetical protein